jgi:RNA 2',3'-cyclic 3'-phosphodiesterase
VTRGLTARLFVALEPPRGVCEQLAEWARGAVGAALPPSGDGLAAGARLLEAQALHVTLCFLGDRPVGEIEALVAAMQECSGAACELSLGAPLWLPPRSPRALAVEIHDRAGELARLQRAMTRALAHASTWRPERRGFRAHMTVARLPRPEARSPRRPTRRAPLEPTPQLRFTAESLVLQRSWLAPEGASYEALATHLLRAPLP